MLASNGYISGSVNIYLFLIMQCCLVCVDTACRGPSILNKKAIFKLSGKMNAPINNLFTVISLQ